MEDLVNGICIGQYLEIALYVILIILYALSTGKKITVQTVLSLMLRVEKDADDLLLKDGNDKLKYVVDKGYLLLPKPLRMVMSLKTFERLAVILYLEAKRTLLEVEEKEFKEKLKKNVIEKAEQEQAPEKTEPRR
jgi:bifunctional DNA-binding transcriptional regulator/antitoxin component of YhaV-PrlF toxin-antitoxin module